MDKDSNPSNDDAQNQQRGIFSTPELTVNTEKITADIEAAAETSRAKIASIFANTETGKQAQRLNDAMGVSAAPATEDIVIDNGIKKKKKWTIVVAVTALVLAAVGVGWHFLLQDKTPRVNTDYKSAFYSYANFFLHNTESSSEIEGLYQYGDTYYIGTLRNEAQIDEHFAKSEEKYQQFLEVFREYEKQHPDDETALNLTDSVKTYYEDLDLARYLAAKPNISIDTLLGAYLEDPNEVVVDINEYYGSFTESTVESTRLYGSDYRGQLLELVSGAFDIYTQRDCIDDGQISVTCRQDTTDAQLANANQTLNDFNAFYADCLGIQQRLSTAIYENIWVMNLEMK